MKQILRDDEEYPIKPSDIDATNHFWGAFDNMETEVSAGWIVRFMQEAGCWRAFSFNDINAFYQRKYPLKQFQFNRLVGQFREFFIQTGWQTRSEDWLARGEDDLYRVTHEFIAACYKSSSARSAAAN